MVFMIENRPELCNFQFITAHIYGFYIRQREKFCVQTRAYYLTINLLKFSNILKKISEN